MKASRVISVAVERIELIEQALIAFQYACKLLDTRRHDKTEIRQGRIALLLAIHEELLDAYRNLFMWGNLFPEAREVAKDKAMKHFLSEGHAIMQYLALDGELPSIWHGKDEEEFRKLLEKSSEALDEDDCAEIAAQINLDTATDSN